MKRIDAAKAGNYFASSVIVRLWQLLLGQP